MAGLPSPLGPAQHSTHTLKSTKVKQGLLTNDPEGFGGRTTAVGDFANLLLPLLLPSVFCFCLFAGPTCWPLRLAGRPVAITASPPGSRCPFSLWHNRRVMESGPARGPTVARADGCRPRPTTPPSSVFSPAFIFLVMSPPIESAFEGFRAGISLDACGRQLPDSALFAGATPVGRSRRALRTGGDDDANRVDCIALATRTHINGLLFNRPPFFL